MNDLTVFLLARLDEDEAAIRREWNGNGVTDERFWGTPFQPSRALDEVAAKRRILAYSLRLISEGEDSEPWAGWEVLASLALPYADHSDYRDQWRP